MSSVAVYWITRDLAFLVGSAQGRIKTAGSTPLEFRVSQANTAVHDKHLDAGPVTRISEIPIERQFSLIETIETSIDSGLGRKGAHTTEHVVLFGHILVNAGDGGKVFQCLEEGRRHVSSGHSREDGLVLVHDSCAMLQNQRFDRFSSSRSDDVLTRNAFRLITDELSVADTSSSGSGQDEYGREALVD